MACIRQLGPFEFTRQNRVDIFQPDVVSDKIDTSVLTYVNGIRKLLHAYIITVHPSTEKKLRRHLAGIILGTTTTTVDDGQTELAGIEVQIPLHTLSTQSVTIFRAGDESPPPPPPPLPEAPFLLLPAHVVKYKGKIICTECQGKSFNSALHFLKHLYLEESVDSISGDPRWMAQYQRLHAALASAAGGGP